MENHNLDEKMVIQEEKKDEKEKAAAYVCRSCGAIAPKKKGLCRPEKIREKGKGR